MISDTHTSHNQLKLASFQFFSRLSKNRANFGILTVLRVQRVVCRASALCWFQTTAWSSLAVSELQLWAAMPLWLYHRAASLPSWIEFNCLRSAAVGKAARLSLYWLDAACRLVIPLRQVALAQLNKYHHQSGNAASGKLVWNQHYALPCDWSQLNPSNQRYQGGDTRIP